MDRDFYRRDVLEVAPELLGKYLVRVNGKGEVRRYMITETEAYRGTEDLACHASKGRTRRTEVMFSEGGVLYIYLIYGMYWMINIVTAGKDQPQAVLLRGVEGINGPGRLGRAMEVDKSFNGEDLVLSDRFWVTESGLALPYTTGVRIGVDYAGEWKDKPWRFIARLPG